MTKTLYISIRDCHACGVCEAICPDVFKVNEDLGHAQAGEPHPDVMDKIDQAVRTCPGRCIEWDQAPDQGECFCQKYQEHIKTDSPCCRHPQDYCQHRSACPIAFLERERSAVS
ncbi:MAG: ferredoxin [Pseudomonadota bacterium]